jgi:hydrogenase nickel incorporation protein HypA/HybF
MHEMGLAASVLDIVRQYVPEAQGPLVRRVGVRVGELAGVQSESLAFCFEAIVTGTPYAQAALAIELVPAVRVCQACDERFPSLAMLAPCPRCGSDRTRLEGGTDLRVVDVELDDESVEKVAS